MLAGQEGKLYIGGEWIAPEGNAAEAVVNPATEAVIGHVGIAGPNEVEAVLSAARTAFESGPWRRMSVVERAAILGRLCDWLDQQAGRIRALITAETGSIQSFARTMQYATAMEHARHYLVQATKVEPEALPLEPVATASGATMVGGGLVVYEPVGVCLAITPFNVPFMLNLAKAIPALVMGNTVILKPSPLTPYSALIIADAAEAIGLPAGVLNVVNCGPAESARLTSDPRVDLITFTGSDTVGAAIQAQAAPTLKRCIMELGGKSAMIVRSDGNLDAAARTALASLTFHAGQACAAMTRLVVHNSIRAEFVARVKALFEGVNIGDPADPAVTMGPLIRENSRARVRELVASGLADGATLVTGGHVPEAQEKGYFYRPTLLDEVDNSWRVAREEIFGPVGVVIGFDDDEDAIRIANDSDFGLSGSVFSADVGRAYAIALEMRTGKVNLNGGSGKMSSYHPFGGIKRSGYGREFGDVGLKEFTYMKTLAFHLA